MGVSVPGIGGAGVPANAGLAETRGRPAPEGAGAAPRAVPGLVPPPVPDTQDILRLLAGSTRLPPELAFADTLLHGASHDEATLYLRLWLLAGQGRVLEALELARATAVELPGSAATALLQAVLEHHAGDTGAALEAALKAAALAPPDSAAHRLVEVLARHEAAEQERLARAGGDPARLPPPPVEHGVPTPWAGAVLGSALLHPPGSARPYTAPPSRTGRGADGASPPLLRRLAAFLPLVIAGLAVGALRQPFLAACFLAAIALWYVRRGSGGRSPG